MSARGEPNISAEARQLYAQLRDDGIVVPTVENLAEYRQSLIDWAVDNVSSTQSRYPVDVCQLEIAGVPCRQQTSRHWSEQDGICIVYAYGGGFVCGGSFEDQVITIPMADRCQARVIAVDYRLSPEHPYPAAQQDMMRVYLEMLRQYGAERLVLAGESAGGNQALGLMQRAREESVELPRCAVLLSPWIDLTNRGDSHGINDTRDMTLNNAWVDAAAKMHAAGTPLDDPGISPLFGDMFDLPPCIVTAGSRDLLLSQSLRLAQNLRAAGVSCDLRIWEGLWHVFEYYLMPEAEQSILEVSDFVRHHCASAISRLT